MVTQVTQDLKTVQTTAGHVLRALGKAFLKIFSTFILVGVIGAGVVEGIGYFSLGKFEGLTHIAAIVLGLIVGYAAGLTVLVGEAVGALIQASREAEKGAMEVGKGAFGDVGKVLSGAEGTLGGIVKSVEGGIGGLEHKGESK